MLPVRSSPAPCRPSHADPDLHVVLVGDQAQIEPLSCRCRRRPRSPGDFPLHQAIGMEESPGGGPAQEARQLHQPLLAAAGRAQGRRHRQRRQHRGHGRRRAAARLFLKNVNRPGIAAVMPTLQGPVRADRRRRQRQPQAASTCSSTASWAASSPSTSSRSDKPTIGLMNIGSEEQKGHDLAKDTHDALQRQLISRTVHRQRRGPGHQQGRLRRHRHRRLRRQRGAEGVRGRVRVLHEDGRQGAARRPERRDATRPSRPCRTWSSATIITSTAARRCWASTASASSATAAPATGPSRTPWPWRPTTPASGSTSCIVQELEASLPVDERRGMIPPV